MSKTRARDTQRVSTGHMLTLMGLHDLLSLLFLALPLQGCPAAA